MKIGVNDYGIHFYNMDFPPNGIKYETIGNYIQDYTGLAFPSIKIVNKKIPKLDLLQTYNYLPYNYNKEFIIDCESTNFLWWAFENSWVKSNVTKKSKNFFTLMKDIIKSDNCKKIISKSKYGLALGLKGYFKDKKILSKIDFVYPAIEKIDISPKRNSDKIKILFVGLDFNRKGGLPLLNSFEKLQKDYNNIELHIVSSLFKDSNERGGCERFSGTPQEKQKSIEIINSNKSIYIHNKMHKEKLFKEFYSKMNILAFPSRGETFGNVPLEAMAHGMPVVATEVGVQPEIVSHKKNGFLIPALKKSNKNHTKNYPNFGEDPKKYNPYLTKNLIKNLSILIDDTKLREKMGREGQKIARTKFSFETRNKKLKKIYQEAVL